MSVVFLSVDHVAEPLRVKRGHLEVVDGLFHGHAAVLRPADLLALGTVGGNAVQVVELRAADHLVDAIDQRIGAGEFAGRLGVGMDPSPGQAGKRGFLRKARHLYITKAVIGEPGFKALHSFSLEDELLGLEASARGLGVLGTR